MTISEAPPPDLLLPGQGRRTPRRRSEWGRAYRALKVLLDDPSQTEKALEVIEAMDGPVIDRGIRLMLASSAGRRLYFEQPVLLDALADVDGLRAMPAGSFGNAYYDFLMAEGFDPETFADVLRKKTPRFRNMYEENRWFALRSLLSHDLWHVLTGYGTDPIGETQLLAFTWGQHGGKGRAFLALGAAFRTRPLLEEGWWLAEFIRAWRRGRNAVCLLAAPYEQLLPLPLDEVRRVLKIT